MRHRLLSAVLFGGAALCFWSAAAFFLGGFRETDIYGLLAIATALIAGGIAGPRLAADARSSTGSWRGITAGFLVTLLAYFLGVLAMALWVWTRADQYGSVLGQGMEAIGFTFGMGLVLSVVFLPLSVPFGSMAGWGFYRIARAV